MKTENMEEKEKERETERLVSTIQTILDITDVANRGCRRGNERCSLSRITDNKNRFDGEQLIENKGDD